MASPRNTTTWDWAARINRVIDFITEHLADDLPLARLARVGAFSPFHFHRIFRAQMGETVRAFVARKRVERAMLLLGRGASTRRLTDLALELGFSSQAELSRAFRAFTGVPPSQFRKNQQIPRARPPYPHEHEDPLEVRVVHRRELRLAFVSVTDCFAPGVLSEASRTLDEWRRKSALPEGTWWGRSTDDPFVTPPALCRYELAIAAPDSLRGSGRVHTRTVPAGHFAELAVRGDAAAIDRGWTRLFAEWLPGSRWELENAPGEERFSSQPDFERAELDVVLALPVRR